MKTNDNFRLRLLTLISILGCGYSSVAQGAPVLRIQDWSNYKDGHVNYARQAAQLQSEKGEGLGYRSTPEQENRDKKKISDRQMFEIKNPKDQSKPFIPPPLPADKAGKGLYGLAIFSDDGCTVRVNGKVVEPEKAGVGQTLGKLDQSFHVLKVLLAPEIPVEITVEYTNTIYYRNQENPDIDGCTLFMFFASASILADADHDGVIKKDETSDADHPFEIWPNDDDDEHAPQARQRDDFETSHVDGNEDLADFFPVFLDFQQVLATLSSNDSVVCKLKQADGALNFVETSLTREQAFAYRMGANNTGYGSNLAQSAATATTQQITSGGVELSGAFVKGIKDQNRGVILVEGRKPSKEPLMLVIEKNGSKIAEISLPLVIRARILLLMHGMNSNTATWDDFVKQYFGDPGTVGAGTILDREIKTPALPLMTKDGVRCYRVQFGTYDPFSTRVGLEGVTAANTPGYLDNKDKKRCGDFETFEQLGREVDDSIDALLEKYNNARVILLGHSRGGLSGRAFLQGASPNREAVVGFLTTGTPHRGSRMGRIYQWLKDNPYVAGTNQDDWQVVNELKNNPEGIDLRRPVIQDMASNADGLSQALTELNAGAGNIPKEVRCGEIAYENAKLGFLWRGWVDIAVGKQAYVNYTVFDEEGGDLGEQLSEAARVFILDAGKKSTDYLGDGLIPVADQKYSGLFNPPRSFFTSETHRRDTVLHIEEPKQSAHIMDSLQKLDPIWFPKPQS